MQTHEIKRKPQTKNKFIFITLLLIFIDLILFILIKCNVFLSSDNRIRKSLQPSSSNNNQKIPEFATATHFMNHFFVYYSIIIIINNFNDIYKTFMLFHILSINVYFSSIIKFLFYKTSFNSLSEQEAEGAFIYYNSKGFTLPCTEIMISVSFFLSLWKIYLISYNNSIDNIIKGENGNNKKSGIKNFLFQYFLLFLVIIINGVNVIGIAMIGYYFMSEIIFSLILGIAIYLFVFETNLIWLNDGQILIDFIREKFNLYMIINIILSVISFIPFFIERKISNNSNNNYQSFIEGSYIFISMFIGHIFLMVGYKFEVGYVFEDDAMIYYQFHFPVNLDDMKPEGDGRDNSGSINLARDTEWNNTSGWISLLRLLVTFALSAICFIPYFIIGDNNDKFGVVFFVKYFLCFGLFSIGISALFKIALRFMKLTNETLYSIMIDK